MKANPICKELEDNYVSLFKKIGCDVKLDEEGIHVSATIDKLYILDDVFSSLAKLSVPHHVHIGPNEINIDIRERHFKEVKTNE